MVWRDERWRGAAALGTTVMTWAIAFPAIRIGLSGYSPWALGLLRLSVAAVVLAVAGAVLRPPRPVGRQWIRVGVAGLLGQTLYQGLLMAGELTVPAGTASVLIATAPVFSVLAAAVLLREPVGRRWYGLLVAFAGAVLVGASLGIGGGAGAAIVLAAALCQGLYHVIVKPLAERIGALATTMWSLWAGAVLALPALPALARDAGSAPRGALLAAVFLGIVPSALGYLAWSTALARSTVAAGTVALYLVSPAALVMSWLLLGERPPGLALAGGVLAVAGVVLVRRRPARVTGAAISHAAVATAAVATAPGAHAAGSHAAAAGSEVA